MSKHDGNQAVANPLPRQPNWFLVRLIYVVFILVVLLIAYSYIRFGRTEQYDPAYYDAVHMYYGLPMSGRKTE
jgi:hypothetical protein